MPVWLRAMINESSRGHRPRLQQTSSKRAGSFLPTQFRMQIDLFGPDIESDRAQQIRDTFAALHGFLQTPGKEFDIFLVGIEREFALGEVFRQRVVMIINEIDQGTP